MVSKLSLRIFANSQGPQGSRPQGHFVFFSQGSFCWDRVVVNYDYEDDGGKPRPVIESK